MRSRTNRRRRRRLTTRSIISLRISLSIFNSEEQIDTFVGALLEIAG
jgi:selenocysteine lyase/cysteine desulfurase